MLATAERSRVKLSPWQWAAPLAACLAVILLRLRTATNLDVSGLLTWSERFVDGATPYVDFFEINPPGAFLLYAPGVIVARLLGLTPEVGTDLVVCLLLAASLAAAARTLEAARLLDGVNRSALLALSVLCLAFLPAYAFAQREHIGVIAMLPMLALAAARIAGQAPRRSEMAVAGLGAAIAMIAKPHFALPLLTTMAATVVATRSLRPLVAVEWLVAATGGMIYVLACYWAYPLYFATVPALASLYLQMRLPLAALMQGPLIPSVIILSICLAIVAGRRLAAPLPVVLVIAAAASVATFLQQGKGWHNHGYPAVAFLALAFAVIITNGNAMAMTGVSRSQAFLRIAALALAVPVAAFDYHWFNWPFQRDTTALRAIIERHHPHPRLAAINGDLYLSHPLVRDLGGTWTQRVQLQWAIAGVHWFRKNRTPDATTAALLDRYEREHTAMLAEDLEHGRPDIVLVQRPLTARDFNWQAWAQAQPAVARRLADFDVIGSIDDVVVMGRRKP